MQAPRSDHRPPLRPGEVVGIVAPSGPFDPTRYQAGLALLRERYQVKEFFPAAGPRAYLAGSDPDRADALRAAFRDPEVRAIFAARGGYGAMRILPDLDWPQIAASGIPLVGFSDVTALHLALLAAGGCAAIHGPVVTQLGEQPAASVERLFSLLESTDAPPPIQGRIVVPGEARGTLIGGCLSLVSRLIGTPYLPDLDGSILLLEDVGEAPYQLDRMWTHLRLAGALERIAGVALGDVTDCGGPEAEGALEELAASLGKPTIAGLPIGHGPINLAVPLGAEATIRDGALHFEVAA